MSGNHSRNSSPKEDKEDRQAKLLRCIIKSLLICHGICCCQSPSLLWQAIRAAGENSTHPFEANAFISSAAANDSLVIPIPNNYSSHFAKTEIPAVSFFFFLSRSPWQRNFMPRGKGQLKVYNPRVRDQLQLSHTTSYDAIVDDIPFASGGCRQAFHCRLQDDSGNQQPRLRFTPCLFGSVAPSQPGSKAVPSI